MLHALGCVAHVIQFVACVTKSGTIKIKGTFRSTEKRYEPTKAPGLITRRCTYYSLKDAMTEKVGK